MGQLFLLPSAAVDCQDVAVGMKREARKRFLLKPFPSLHLFLVQEQLE